MPGGQGLRYECHRGGIGERVAEVYADVAAMAGKCVTQGGVAEKAELDQHLAKRALAPLLFVQGDTQLVGADEAGLEQQLADGQGSVQRGVQGRIHWPAPGCAGRSSGRRGTEGRLRWPGEGAETRNSGPGRCAA